MTARLDAYFAAFHTLDGKTERLGKLSEPVASLTLPGTGRLLRTVTIAPEDTVLLWDYLDQRDFELLALRIPGDGYLHCAYKVDTPTSASDLTPSGNDVRWREFDLSCKTPWLMNTDEARIHATLATDAGESAGLPTVLTDGASEDAKVYGVAANNPSTTESVTVEVWVLN